MADDSGTEASLDVRLQGDTNEMGNKMTKAQPAAKEQSAAKVQPAVKEQPDAKVQPAIKEQPDAKEPKKSTFQKFLERFHLSPSKKEPMPSKKVVADGNPPPKPPLRNHAERTLAINADCPDVSKNLEWTEVNLKVPESSSQSKKESEITVTPIPPPRKHKLKLQELLDSPKRIKEVNAEYSSSPSLVPVEEPIIVKQKVIEHVCDGTHHHVRNIVDGVVVDQIISNTNKETKVESRKNASTLSLPSYDDLKKKGDKRTRSPTKPNKKKTSASSLDKKQRPHSAAEKIESYMTRCKSFGSILPNQKTDKGKFSQDDSDKESEDSWGGLEDWDLGIIEHDDSALAQRAPVRSKTKHSPVKTDSRKKASTHQSGIEGIDQLIASIDEDIKKNDAIQTTQLPTNAIENKSASLRSGSYPFKKSPEKNAFENDAFFTSEFLRNESLAQEYTRPTKVTLAPLAAFDSDRESEKDLHITNEGKQNESKKSVAFTLSEDTHSPEVENILAEKVTVRAKLTENKISMVPEVTNIASKDRGHSPKATPRRRSGIGHSNLLKFIKDDLKDHESTEKSGLNKKNPPETYNEVEPEIVPNIRKHKIEASWQELIKRNDINDTPLLDQESVISDLVETSSDDTRSTVETKYKI